jgi:acetyl-CoA C-acetyltransferase
MKVLSDSGLERKAAIVGYCEYKAKKMSEQVTQTGLEQAADLTLRALEDAGLSLADVNGISVAGIFESAMFVPSTVTEYLGITVDFADALDLGGATCASMIGRAALAIEAGMTDVVVCVVPGNFPPPSENGLDWRYLGASSYNPGSPQAEFEIPFGHLGQNVPYAFIAQRYAARYGYDERALAKLVVSQRFNACANPDAIFYGQPLNEDEVLSSRMIAPPLRMLDIVRPITGGAAVVVANAKTARRCAHRPVAVASYAETVAHKSPQFAADILKPPLARAAARAFASARLAPGEIDAAQIYDCYSIAVLMGLEAAGFCPPGTGFQFLRDNDLTFRGDFPLNTNGGQLGFGQAGAAGGMTHVVEGARQIMQRAAAHQVDNCQTVFVSGNGGIMSEQCALILQGL